MNVYNKYRNKPSNLYNAIKGHDNNKLEKSNLSNVNKSYPNNINYIIEKRSFSIKSRLSI